MASQTETLKVSSNNPDTSFSDTVFHLTPAYNVPAILKKGLHPDPERGKKASWRRLEKFMDGIRPDSIRELGISRRYGVYAYPDIEVLKPRYLGELDYKRFQESNRQAEDDTAFAIDVDPAKVMVFDMGDLRGIEGRLEENARRGITEQDPRAVEAGLRYWNNGLTLQEFRARYESRHNEWFSDCGLKEEYRDGSPNLKYSFWTPEVIVPGPITGEAVRWAASKLTILDLEQQ
jgi:hypothetical protein